MKKLFCLLFAASLFITSCDDGDDNYPPVTPPFELKGNIYSHELTDEEDTEKIFEQYEFTSDTQVQYVQRKDSPQGDIHSTPVFYTYRFDDPVIHMTNGGRVLTGVFENQDSLQVYTSVSWFVRVK